MNEASQPLDVIATSDESVKVSNRGCANSNKACTVSLHSRFCMLQGRPETRHRKLFSFLNYDEIFSEIT
jgi:hypothetical protein